MMFPVMVASQIWRAQIEQGVRILAWWAQFLPHETARQAADEAEAQRLRPRKRG